MLGNIAIICVNNRHYRISYCGNNFELFHHLFFVQVVFLNRMDSLTQIVLGGAIGELVAGRKLGNRAVLWGAIAGTIPDLDVFLRFFYHPIEAALVHRGFSHSLLFALMAGPLLGLLFNVATKRVYGFWLWTHLFFWGIVTHPLLDMFTNYGTQFFWPFEARITFNSVFVIDPLYTIPFMVLLIWAMRLNKESLKRRKLNRIGLIYSTAYLLLGLLIKWYVWYNADQYFAKNKVHIDRMMVTPMPFTCLYWYVLGENTENFYVAYESILSKQTCRNHECIAKGKFRIETLEWEGDSKSKELAMVTNGYYLMNKERHSILCYDLRFGWSDKLTNGKLKIPLMGYRFYLDKGKIKKTKTIKPNQVLQKSDFKQYLQYIIKE